MHQPLRLRCDEAALAANYRSLQTRAGAQAGAAIKANAYGLGAAGAARALWNEGCRDFFVSTYWEAAELAFLPTGSISVLHGIGPTDEPLPGVRPVLISVEQIARWKSRGGPAQPCDVMIDTGMNRLGITREEIGALDGLTIHTLHSHLACADEEHPLNAAQLSRFRAASDSIPAQRYSLANSAGIFLGRDYAFDLVRPGLALYGGIPRSEARSTIKPVLSLEAQVVQVRRVRSGESVGYNATFVAPSDMSVAIINVGYADGYRRHFSSLGKATFGGAELPVIGRVSMDLVALDAGVASEIGEGDWVTLDFDLERSAALTGQSQYELLTGLGRRYQRIWS
ncbi:alanine racemase [Sphingomonas swuensis]